jgi:hypothetical protein
MTEHDLTENQRSSFIPYVSEDVVDHCLAILKLAPDAPPKQNTANCQFPTNKEKLWDNLGELFFIFKICPLPSGPNKATKLEFNAVLDSLKKLNDLLDKQVPEPPFKKEDFNSSSQELVLFFITSQSRKANPLAKDIKRVPSYFNDTKDLVQRLRLHIRLYEGLKSDFYSKISGRGKNKSLNEKRQYFCDFVFSIYQEMTGEKPKATTSDKGIENGKKTKRAGIKDSKSIQLLDYLLPHFHFTKNDTEPSAEAIKKRVIKYNNRKVNA